jgi:hypothetical protein
MDWMQQQNWNRDKEAYVLQNASQNWMKDQDQARNKEMYGISENDARGNANMSALNAANASNAGYERQRQLMQDQAQINFNQTGRPSTTSVIGGGGAGGSSGGGGGSSGGGGSGGGLSDFDWLANEKDNELKSRALDIQQAQLDQQTRLGYDQNDANRFAAVQQKDAAMLASFLNASISRR